MALLFDSEILRSAILISCCHSIQPVMVIGFLYLLCNLRIIMDTDSGFKTGFDRITVR